MNEQACTVVCFIFAALCAVLFCSGLRRNMTTRER